MTEPVDLAFERYGLTGDAPIVLLGSLGSDVSMWHPQIDALSDEHDIIAVDLRGHGDSPVPTGPYSMGELADDVVALLDRLDVADAHIVGLSLGGAIAQQLALSHSDRVRTLTLLCTSAKFATPEAWHDRARTVRAEGASSIADAIVGRWFTAEFAQRNPGLIGRMLDMIGDVPDEGYAGCCEALADFDSRDELGDITAPTLVIGGAEDPSTPPEHQRLLADSIRDSKLHIIDRAAHLASFEQRSNVNAAIAALVGDHR